MLIFELYRESTHINGFSSRFLSSREERVAFATETGGLSAKYYTASKLQTTNIFVASVQMFVAFVCSKI